MQEVADSGQVTSTPRLDLLRTRLEKGACIDDANALDASVIGIANSINEIAIAMTRLPDFQARQTEVFSVLRAVASF